MQCIYCNKIFSNAGGLGSHKPHCNSNPNRVQRKRSPKAGAQKGSTPWNKDLVNDIRCKHSEKTKLILKEKCTGKAKTEEGEIKRKQKITEQAKLKNGGYRQGSGRGKKGWYKGFFCDSSWELAFVIYCLEHNLDIKRNTEKRKYIWNGVVKNYIPDFIVEGSLTEVKGYKTEQWLAKLEANPDVKVLYEKDLEPVLTYVKRKYGKDFICLYE